MWWREKKKPAHRLHVMLDWPVQLSAREEIKIPKEGLMQASGT
jgi:hypothetical protein